MIGFAARAGTSGDIIHLTVSSKGTTKHSGRLDVVYLCKVHNSVIENKLFRKMKSVGPFSKCFTRFGSILCQQMTKIKIPLKEFFLGSPLEVLGPILPDIFFNHRTNFVDRARQELKLCP